MDFSSLLQAFAAKASVSAATKASRALIMVDVLLGSARADGRAGAGAM